MEQIDLFGIWAIIRKRWVIIVVLPLIALLTSAILSYFVIKPVYQATATMIVGKKPDNQSDKQMDYTTVLANKQLATTYGAIAKSRTVLSRVGSQVQGGLGSAQISVSVVKDTEVLAISVQDRDPARAAQIANVLTTEFSTRIKEVKKVDSVSVVDAAVENKTPIKPDKANNMLLGFVLGLLVSVTIIIVLEVLDNTVRTAEDIEKITGLQVIGRIPQFSAVETRQIRMGDTI